MFARSYLLCFFFNPSFGTSDLSVFFLVYFFSCKGKLCDNVFLCRIAVEGIVFSRNINTVKGLYVAVIIFDVKTVCFQRISVNKIVLTVIVTAESESVF